MEKSDILRLFPLYKVKSAQRRKKDDVILAGTDRIDVDAVGLSNLKWWQHIHQFLRVQGSITACIIVEIYKYILSTL
jgi:hypothetical protein